MQVDGDWGTPFLGYGQASALTTRAAKKRAPVTPHKGERRPASKEQAPFGFSTSKRSRKE